jgi:hypothetical protein
MLNKNILCRLFRAAKAALERQGEHNFRVEFKQIDIKY